MAVRASEAWAALRDAGVRLHDRRGALELAIPEARAVGPLEALGRAAGAHLWPIASDAWRRELEGWPVALQDEWSERAALREFDGGQPRGEAERAAFVEVRERALAPYAPTLAALAAELGAVLVAVEADEGRGVKGSDAASTPPTEPAPRPRATDAARPCRTCGLHLAARGRCARCHVAPPAAERNGRGDTGGRRGT